MHSELVWEIMHDTVNTVSDCTRIATGVMSTLKIRPERMLSGVLVCGCAFIVCICGWVGRWVRLLCAYVCGDVWVYRVRLYVWVWVWVWVSMYVLVALGFLPMYTHVCCVYACCYVLISRYWK